MLVIQTIGTIGTTTIIFEKGKQTIIVQNRSVRQKNKAIRDIDHKPFKF